MRAMRGYCMRGRCCGCDAVADAWTRRRERVCMGMRARVRARAGLGQESHCAPVEALLVWSRGVNDFDSRSASAAVCFACGGKTYERTRIKEGVIYIRVKTTDAKSEKRFVSKYQHIDTHNIRRSNGTNKLYQSHALVKQCCL